VSYLKTANKDASRRSALPTNNINKKPVPLGMVEYWNNGTYCGFFGLKPHHSTIPLFPWVAGFARVSSSAFFHNS